MGGRCPPKDEIRTLRDSDRTGDVLKTRKEFAKSLLLPPTGLWALSPAVEPEGAEASSMRHTVRYCAGARSVQGLLEMTMTKLTKSQSDLLALLVDDTRRFGHGLSGRLRRVSHAIRRRLWGGDSGVLEEVTKAKTKPDLLAVLEDDVRQCAGAVGALFGGLNRLRGGTNRTALTTSESAGSAQDPARQP